MFIKVKHQEFRGVELADGTLIIHSMHKESRVLQEQVKDVAVGVRSGILQIVAFLDQDYAWYYSGEKDLEREKIELGQVYSGGGRLITDGVGNSHLFYFIKQSPGHSVLLRHQVFTDKWSNPIVVSTNVFADGTSFSVAWHHDNYLHIAYTNYRAQHLLYRVYDLEHRIWSGAVPFSDQRCSHPQLISSTKLYLFWQEDDQKIRLKVRQKEKNWSQTSQVSQDGHHASNVGYAFEDNGWNVFWGEKTKFYRSLFDHWAEPQLIERDNYNYAWVVYEHLTIPVYELKETLKPKKSELTKSKIVAEEPEVKSAEVVMEEPAPVASTPPVVSAPEKTSIVEKTKEEKRRESDEAKLQAAFLEKAFRTLQEWENLKGEIQRWRAEFKTPEVVDLSPLITRIERLERRQFTMQKGQEQNSQDWEGRFKQAQQELDRQERRIRELESDEKRVSLWRRVLGRS